MNAPREPLSKTRILSAALRVVDEGGVESLSMRRLASVLGVQAMSLYNHVTNKDEILDGLVALVVGEIEPPSLSVEWKEAMRRRANSAHRVLLRHPWAILALMTRINVGTTILAYVNATLGCLRKAGFSAEAADRARNAMDNHIYGYTLRSVSFPFEAPEYAESARELLSHLPTGEYPYFAELATLVIEDRYSSLRDFDFGLNLILDGLETYRILR